MKSKEIEPSADNLKGFLQSEQKKIDDALDNWIPPEDEKPSNLYKAIRHSVFAGGKRIRPILLSATAMGFEFFPELVYPAGAAIEMIHTYSLIHDDLPALDNDDLRRGKPTCHKAFGEPMAILAGDALNTFAFAVLSSIDYSDDMKAVGLQVVKELADAAGIMGMVRGQVADVEAEGKKVSAEELKFIHENKTSALIVCSIRMGGLVSNADEESMKKLTHLGSLLGLAFQIKDDILDITSTSAELGKSVGKDEDQQKATYPAIHGIDFAKKKLKELSEEAIILAKEIREAKWLQYIAAYLLNRRN